MNLLPSQDLKKASQISFDILKDKLKDKFNLKPFRKKEKKKNIDKTK